MTDRFFKGWLIVLFTFVIQFVTVGLSYYAFSVYLKPLVAALDTDRFSISLTLSIQMVVIACLSPVAGKLFAAQSIRLLMSVGVAALLIGHLLLTQITEVWQLYILYGGLIGIGSVFLGMLPSNMLLANWFEQRRGSAMGISQFGITISATVLVPVVTWLILDYGWRQSFAISGVLAAVILLPMIWKYAIKTPEEVGLYPDGVKPEVVEQTTSIAQDWPTTRVLRNPRIWLITLVVGPCYMAIGAIVLALPAHATDLGISALQAAGIVALTTLMGALAKPIFGTLADHFDKRLVVAVALTLQIIGIAILLNVSSRNGMLMAGFFFGLGYGGIAPLWSILLASLIGRAAFARVMGINLLMLLPFTISGLPLTNYIFEVSGSYLPAFSIMLGGYAVSALALMTLRIPRN